MEIKCPVCNLVVSKPSGQINRALKLGLNIYCSRKCSGIGRRSTKSDELKRKEKSEYDKEYREKNKALIKLKKAAYTRSESGIKMQRKRRAKLKESGYHNEYCRKPEQRQKERERRYLKAGLNELKFCIVCMQHKPKISFTRGHIFKDGRYYLCRDCEIDSKHKTGLSTRSVIGVIHQRSWKLFGSDGLTRAEIAEHPYLIEANKYFISLKNLLNEKC